MSFLLSFWNQLVNIREYTTLVHFTQNTQKKLKKFVLCKYERYGSVQSPSKEKVVGRLGNRIISFYHVT